ncbi:OmpA family protein [Bernardetia sp. Wsw4-3y2]|uniref:OmpA family protein n=1 Tax=Bernardetia sp. Wsw4-3y2 TaxID=3127471 RepID=UPI0030D0CDF4
MKVNKLYFLSVLSIILIFKVSSLSAQDSKNLPKILKHPDSVHIEAIEVLNSESRETNLSVTPDGKYLFFMSSRGGENWSIKSGIYKNQVRYDGDIYFSKKDSTGKWTAAQNLKAINSSSGEDEPFVSQDGQQVVFQSWRRNWMSEGGPYYKAKYEAKAKGNSWTNIKGLGQGINSFFRREFSKYGGYATDGMSVSSDFNTFIVAAGTNYSGDMDLYWSKKDSTGKWTVCTEMPISTPKNERSVFLAADNKTIYFASDGYGGFGGLDIFKALLDENGNAIEIFNIGAPFNTDKDDYGFVLTASGEAAYFVREGDIFYADLINASPEIKPSPVLLLEGNIVGCDENPIDAKVSLYDENDKEISVSFTNARNKGEYVLLVSNPPKTKKLYKQIIETEKGFEQEPFFETKKIEIPSIKKYTKIELGKTQINDCKEEIEKTEKITKLEIVYFDFDSDELDQNSIQVLENLIAVFNQNLEKNHSTQKIILTGHTDSKGSNEYNEILSQKRLLSVQDFLERKGIDKSKIKITPKGEKNPTKTNATENGRSKNRRVEIMISDK